MKCVLVYNPKSGSALSLRDLKKTFANADIELVTTLPIAKVSTRTLAPFIKKHLVIAVYGGDGTISSVASLLLDTKAILLPLPGGTLNHFTKDLGVPQSLNEALARAKRVSPKNIDVATVNGQVFLNNSSLGLYPASLQVRDRFEDRFGKWPSAAIGMVRALVQFHHYHVTINGKEMTTPFIFVGNNTYKIGLFGVASRPSLQRGKLFVATVRATKRSQLLKIFWYALLHKLRAEKSFDTYSTSHDVVIQTSRKHLHVSRDGELMTLESPLTYEIHPGALLVLV